jgi:hypothetical protein
MKPRSKPPYGFKAISTLLALFGLGAVGESKSLPPPPIVEPSQDIDVARGQSLDPVSPVEAIRLPFYAAQEYGLLDAQRIVELGEVDEAKEFLRNLERYLRQEEENKQKPRLTDVLSYTPDLSDIGLRAGHSHSWDYADMIPGATNIKQSNPPRRLNFSRRETVINFATLNQMMSLVSANNPTSTEADNVKFIENYIASKNTFIIKLSNLGDSQIFSQSESGTNPSLKTSTGEGANVGQQGGTTIIINEKSPSGDEVGGLLSGFAALWAAIFRREESAPRRSKPRRKKRT